MLSYIALIRKEPESSFGVDFPDFPRCISGGDTLEEAKESAQEGSRGHIQVMLDFGEPIPEPSSLDEVMADPQNSDALAFLVEIPALKAKRINITIPESDLPAIDGYAAQCRMSRSAFLVWAAKRAIESQLRP